MLKPRNNFVLIERDKNPAEQMSKGGLYLPSLGQIPKSSGEVLAVGPKVTDLKVGDHVLLPQHAGHSIDVEGMACVLVEDFQILATF